MSLMTTKLNTINTVMMLKLQNSKFKSVTFPVKRQGCRELTVTNTAAAEVRGSSAREPTPSACLPRRLLCVSDADRQV